MIDKVVRMRMSDKYIFIYIGLLSMRSLDPENFELPKTIKEKGTRLNEFI